MNQQDISESKGTDTGEGTAEKGIKIADIKELKHSKGSYLVALVHNKEVKEGDKQLTVEKRRYLFVHPHIKKVKEERDKRIREEFERRVQSRRSIKSVTTKFIKRGRVVREVKNGVCKRFKEEDKSK